MSNDSVQPLKVSRLSLAAQAQQYLLGLIRDGTYHPGEQLLSEKELAAQLGISRPTLREALQNLEQEGFVLRRHGVGTFVSRGYENRLESGLERLESIIQLAAPQRKQVRVGDLQVQQTLADTAIADRLQVAIDTPLTSVHRTILIDGRPVAYMADYAPTSILAESDVGQSFNGSVLDLLRQNQGLKISQAMANIVAINADGFLTSKLKVKPGQALLLLEETVFDDEGKVVEFSRNFFIPDCFQFHIVRR
jgi:GntR family transcriptional regulator